VILIIAAIAIPNYLKSKMLANEASAVQGLRNIATAELVYSTTYGIDFSDSLLKLSGNGVTVDQNNAGLIDEVLASGRKSGYIFTYTVLTTDGLGHASTYSVAADPIIPWEHRSKALLHRRILRDPVEQFRSCRAPGSSN